MKYSARSISGGRGLYNRLVLNRLTRRTAGKSLLTGLAAGSALSGAAKRPLGFQLYTIRKLLPAHARVALQRLAQTGYQEIESIRAFNPVVLPLCKEFGIKAVSCHYDTPLVTGNFYAWKSDGPPAGYNWDRAVEDAAVAGVRYMVIAYLMPAERGSLDTFRRYADQFNKAGEGSRKAGMQFCYHHHAFEFGPKEGSRPIDVFLERCDPKLVKFEMDVFWASVAGEDPVSLLSQWKGRVALMHLKDKAPGLKPHYIEELSPNAFREVGLGVVDFAKILAAARQAGVEHYFVEQDEMAEDPVESLGYSFSTLERLGF
jgi:sugar phosphate isomerase/epimerase